MAKNRTLTNGKLPQATCPVCAAQVVKTIMYGQLSYDCGAHWGPWEDRVKSPPIEKRP